MPVSATDWGPFPELSKISRSAFRGPLEVGENVTLIVQVPPAGIEEEVQSSVSAKSLASTPVTEMLVMLNLPFPLK